MKCISGWEQIEGAVIWVREQTCKKKQKKARQKEF